MVFVIVVLLVIAVVAFASGSGRREAQRLSNNFVRLGIIPGKTMSEIQAVVGAPSGYTALGNGRMLYQWVRPGYVMGIVFVGDVAEGIAHELAV